VTRLPSIQPIDGRSERLPTRRGPPFDVDVGYDELRLGGRRHFGGTVADRVVDADSVAIVLLALFAGLYVSEYELAKEFYVRLFGNEPSFLPNDIEAVWELAEHRSVYIKVQPEDAGRSVVTLFVDDLDERVGGIEARGIEPARRDTYDNGVCKVTFRDPDGNEIGFGGAPVS
jgi:predicted enzyme related to lactoylglutathione lyase